MKSMLLVVSLLLSSLTMHAAIPEGRSLTINNLDVMVIKMSDKILQSHGIPVGPDCLQVFIRGNIRTGTILKLTINNNPKLSYIFEYVEDPQDQYNGIYFYIDNIDTFLITSLDILQYEPTITSTLN